MALTSPAASGASRCYTSTSTCTCASACSANLLGRAANRRCCTCSPHGDGGDIDRHGATRAAGQRAIANQFQLAHTADALQAVAAAIPRPHKPQLRRARRECGASSSRGSSPTACNASIVSIQIIVVVILIVIAVLVAAAKICLLYSKQAIGRPRVQDMQHLVQHVAQRAVAGDWTSHAGYGRSQHGQQRRHN